MQFFTSLQRADTPTLTLTKLRNENIVFRVTRSKRIKSIDLLRGIVMIIMAIDHTRDYFHYDAFFYSPTDLEHTNIATFFTRWITHFCAPIFVFLAGISANLYGAKKSKRELSFFLFSRGAWLVLVELFIIGLGKTFNPSFHFFNLQVIWAIGISMIVLSGLIYMNLRLILLFGILLIGGHNLLDQVHVPGNSAASFFWALLHDPGFFTAGNITIRVHYPLLPWIGIMALGYCAGRLYARDYDLVKRGKTFFLLGMGAMVLFIILRSGNFYGDITRWPGQNDTDYSLLAFLNVTKYPPSFLYTLMTLGPALIFLSLTEKPLNAISERISMFGRVPMFFYIVHFYLLHFLATIAAVISGHQWTDMILDGPLNDSPSLKGYGFNLLVVYLIWIALILMLYPICKWFDRYKRENLSKQRWLSYL